MTFLVLDSVSKQYGDSVAVDKISFTTNRGEFISLLGPSGCGKTTTLQMIAGFVDPSQGRIALEGRDLSSIKANNRGLGVVFQSYALFPHMSVAENVAFGLKMRKVEDGVLKAKVDDILELMHLAPMKNRLPKQLSGGQRQRVALARALVIEPPVLLLDEPLSNLDAKLREDMQIELRRVQRTFGTTTIMVTHDQAEAMALSDRVVVMNKGQIEQIGEPDLVYENPSSSFVAKFLGKANILTGRVKVTSSNSPVVEVNGCALPIPLGLADTSGQVTFSVRPEKISITQGKETAGSVLKATIKLKTFCGDHWIYDLDSPVGQLTVRKQNDGTPYREGDIVSVRWSAADMKVIEAK